MKRLAILAGSALAGALIAAAALAQETPRERGGGLEHMLRSADSNGDGSITKAEAQASREQHFTRMDANGDGYLTDADRQMRREEAKQKTGAGRMGRARDADGDGRISRAEFLSGEAPWFERFDANNNDVLEPSEIEAIRTRHAQHGAAPPAKAQ